MMKSNVTPASFLPFSFSVHIYSNRDGGYPITLPPSSSSFCLLHNFARRRIRQIVWLSLPMFFCLKKKIQNKCPRHPSIEEGYLSLSLPVVLFFYSLRYKQDRWSVHRESIVNNRDSSTRRAKVFLLVATTWTFTRCTIVNTQMNKFLYSSSNFCLRWWALIKSSLRCGCCTVCNRKFILDKQTEQI